MASGHGLRRSSTSNFSSFAAILTLGLILLMIILTSLYLPKTYGEILSCQEFYPAGGPFTFIVELGEDEYWHVKSWTETPRTRYNVTLTGYPIEERVETGALENDCFTCRWGLSLESSGTYDSYEFDTKVPSSSSDLWEFSLLLEGHGGIHIVIDKFDRHSFYMFFIPDLICIFGLFILVVFSARQNEIAENVEHRSDLFCLC